MDRVLQDNFRGVRFVSFCHDCTSRSDRRDQRSIAYSCAFRPYRRLLQRRQDRTMFNILSRLSCHRHTIVHSRVNFYPSYRDVGDPGFEPRAFRRVTCGGRLSSTRTTRGVCHGKLSGVERGLGGGKVCRPWWSGAAVSWVGLFVGGQGVVRWTRGV